MMKKITLQTDLSKNIAPPVYVFLLFLLLFFSALSAFAQAGKDGALTVTTANTVLNRYTRVTTDVLAGSNTITVADINDLNRDGITYLPGGFVTNSSVYANNALSTGDLVVMYQAQGAIINATNTINYGTVTNFNGAGTFEFATVESVSGNTITLGCRTKNSYFADRYVQVLRVPQYTTLTVNAGASVAAIPWGSPAFGGADPSALTRRRGGFMVVHSTNIVNNGTIHANEAGFRGGTRENNTSAAGDNFYTDFRTNDSNLSAEKGESIAGYRDDYDNLYNGRYGRGAPANGGGGGNAHNAGGGGGANGGNPAGWFRGAGVMNDFRPAAGGCGNPGAWALDPDYIANGNALTNSQGGGRGGYSFAFSNQNACILGPSYPANFIAPGVPASNVLNTSWGGDRRDAVGGLGGRPLVSNSFQNQIFFGGGGGAGDGNNNANNDGGDGGGIVFLIATGNITGSGIISANGENGFNTLPSHNDAPGGGGGGGTVAIQTTSIANTISIRANGGNGGSQLITNDESEGPGGGGGGGVIAINATTDGSAKQVNGGQNGTTSSAAVTEFIANGATSGNSGTITTVSVSLFSVVCTTNLGINKAIDNSSPNVGSNVTFTLTVNNAGPDPATGVVVNDLLPSGYTFVSSTPSQGTYNSGTGVWNVGNIAIGGNATLTIIATVNATGSYTNTATVTGDQNDPNLSNNTSSVTPTPVPQTNLGVTKTASNMMPPIGSNITFTITASNAGPSNATGVVVNDLLPSGYTFVSATASQGTYNNVTGVWSVGSLANGGSATLTITVTVNATGSYANTATISGNENDPTPANNTSTSTPTPVNLAPDAVNDSYTMPQNGNLSNSVATNDILQAGGNPHTFSLVSGGSAAANGTLVFNSDGTFTYTPNTGFSGTVSFTYQVCNSVTPVPQCDTAVATIVVLPPPVAVNDTAATPINTPVNGNASTNDNLPSGGTYTYTVTTPPANGSVVMNPDGTYTYTPNTGFTGTDTFTYQVCNQVGQCSTATVTVTVLPPPVAVNDSAVTPINTPVNGNASTNDNLPSGGTYTYTVTTPPTNGNVTMNPDGTYTYTPNTGFTGTDTFTYQVCNQVGQCSTATVTVTVLPPPVAVNDSAVTPINTPVNGNASTNDNLPSGGTYTYTVTTPPTNGNVTMNPDGTYTYTPNTGFTGTDTFTYQVCNQVGQCSTATVTVTVLPPPVAVNDSAVTPINTPVNGNASTNDNLPSGGTYTYTVTTPPANGSVVMNPDGTYTYTPNTGFTGTDTFTYQVCNQVGQCSTATVTVTVLPPPVAVNDSAVTPINTPVNGNASTNDNLPSGGTYTYTVTTPPANGSVVMNPDGTYTYTPNTGFTGTDTFTYQVCNQLGQCSTATITVTVLPPPVAVNDSAVTPINTPVNGNASTNDNLPSGGTYTYTVTTPPANGSVVMNPDGTYTYTPNTGFTGTDTFTYQVCNQVGQCSTATVTVTVLPPPVAVNDSAVTPINTPVNGNASTNDNLPSGGTYTYTVTTLPANGSVVMNPDGTYTYTPNTDFTGTDTFTYQVCNQVGQCSTATVTVTVLPPPVAVNDSAVTPINTPVNGNASTNDNLPSGGTYTYTVTTPPANGSVVMNPDGTYTYTPNTGFTGTDTFTYQVCNQVGQCSTATVTVTVLPPPVAVNDSAVTPINTPVSGDLGTNDNLPAGGTYTFSLVDGGSAAANGTLVVNPDGTYTFTPNPGFSGVVTFTYQVCNQAGVCSTATVTITVLAPPVANNDTAGTLPNTPVNGNVSSNDNLPSGGTYTYAVTTPPANGSVVMNPDGTYTYTPNPGFVGTDTFTYTVCNQLGECSTATVTITVGQPPVANNDEYNTGANTPVSGNVGTNDQNPSGGATTYNLVNGGTAAQNGTLVFNPDGTFTFTPNQGFVGTVTFTYEICNPVGCSQATVTINVAAPVQANDDNFNATPGNPVNGNVGANDQIPAGQNPTYTLVNGGTAAANGTLVVNPNGTFTFTPNAGFVGTVSFTYQVCNEFGQCSTATVTIVVEDPVVQIPEGFSPNNDGINDTFVIKGRNGRPVDLKIYNRWGNLVYENPNYQDDWNGTSNIGIRIGEQLPDGTYYYTAEFKDTGERYARYLTIRR